MPFVVICFAVMCLLILIRRYRLRKSRRKALMEQLASPRPEPVSRTRPDYQTTEEFLAVNPDPPGSNLYKFRCAEMGQTRCKWEIRGQSEDEVMRQIEQHAVERHRIGECTPEIKNRAYRLIHRIPAA
jgi:predicted small metal-binding protein